MTRGEEQADAFAEMIRARGGIPVPFPTVRIAPVEDRAALDGAVAELASYDWLLFTSANGVRYFLLLGGDAVSGGLPPGLRVGSVGPGTSECARREGLPVHLEAATHTAEGLAGALAREGVAGRRFLFPRASEGREVLVEELERGGGVVTAVPVYRNGLPERDDAAAAAILAEPPDVCTFASPSSFRNLFPLLGEEEARRMLAASRIAVIGEVTARAVEKRGFTPDILPATFTLPGLLDAIDAHFRKEGA